MAHLVKCQAGDGRVACSRLTAGGVNVVCP